MEIDNKYYMKFKRWHEFLQEKGWVLSEDGTSPTADSVQKIPTPEDKAIMNAAQIVAKKNNWTIGAVNSADAQKAANDPAVRSLGPKNLGKVMQALTGQTPDNDQPGT